MNNLLQILTNLGSITSFIVTALAALVPVLAYVFEAAIRRRVKEISVPTALEPQRDHLTRRLNEGRRTLKKLEREAFISNSSNTLLIVGQYVVGGTLASSFIQQSLSPQIIGSLGVVVLVASVFHQRFRPDIRAGINGAKARYLRSALRKVEDDMAARKSGEENIPSEPIIISELSKALDKVDNDKEWEKEVQRTPLTTVTPDTK